MTHESYFCQPILCPGRGNHLALLTGLTELQSQLVTKGHFAHCCHNYSKHYMNWSINFFPHCGQGFSVNFCICTLSYVLQVVCFVIKWDPQVKYVDMCEGLFDLEELIYLDTTHYFYNVNIRWFFKYLKVNFIHLSRRSLSSVIYPKVVGTQNQQTMLSYRTFSSKESYSFFSTKPSVVMNPIIFLQLLNKECKIYFLYFSDFQHGWYLI